METKNYKIVISEDALSMLDRHVEFLARASASAAHKFVNDILKDIDSLKKLPERYPVYENRFMTDNPYRRLLSGRRYLVLYELAKDTVFVDYILDCRQENREFLLDF
jgi:plasmid stabilization system protein ParE